MASKRCSTPEYTREYWKFKRHLDYYLQESLGLKDGDFDAMYSQSQIIDLLLEKTGFRILPETLSRALKKLGKNYGEVPLEPLYKINRGFFERHPPKAPKEYRRD
jgi:hypothetical protein